MGLLPEAPGTQDNVIDPNNVRTYSGDWMKRPTGYARANKDSSTFLTRNREGRSTLFLGDPKQVDQGSFNISNYQPLQRRLSALEGQRGARADQMLDRGAADYDRARNYARHAVTRDGPSAAEIQMRSGQEDALRSSLAMARSQRGYGAGAERNAQFQASQGMARANRDAAQLRAQEEQARRADALRFAGMEGQQYGRAQQTALGLGSQQQQMLQQSGALGGAQQRAQAEYQKIRASRLDNRDLRNAQFYNNATPQVDTTAQDWATGAQVAGTAAGALAMFMSDEDSKKKIQKLEEENTRLRALGGGDQDANALDAFRNAPSKSFEYKDPDSPGQEEGRQYGVMAQDLERTAPGASVVRDTPSGKMVDGTRLAALNAAATGEAAREIDSLRGQVTDQERRLMAMTDPAYDAEPQPPPVGDMSDQDMGAMSDQDMAMTGGGPPTDPSGRIDPMTGEAGMDLDAILRDRQRVIQALGGQAMPAMNAQTPGIY